MIIVIGDFDVDGVISIFLCMLVLVDMGVKWVDYLVLNCFDFGYGLLFEIVDVVVECGIQLIIIVDNGIVCYVGVECVKVLGMMVIVIDYYLLVDILLVVDVIVNFN